MTTFLVTGGAGFIGSNFVHCAVAADHSIVNLDVLSYAGNLDNLVGLRNLARHTFVHGSIGDGRLVRQLLAQHQLSVIVNFAAETHVDRSVEGPAVFIRTNIDGTYELLEAALAHWRTRSPSAPPSFRVLHVSTDEVFGSAETGKFTEEEPLCAEFTLRGVEGGGGSSRAAFNSTYGLPTLVTNCGNNYGPRQLPHYSAHGSVGAGPETGAGLRRRHAFAVVNMSMTLRCI